MLPSEWQRAMNRAILPVSRGLSRCARSSPLFYRLVSYPPQLQSPAVCVRVYHASGISYQAKAKKGKKGDDDNDSKKPVVELPNIKAYEQAMESTFKWFVNELAKIKVGSASVEMFANMQLPASSYGTVGRAGQVLLKTSTKLVVAVYDPSVTSLVADALRGCGLNLSPTIEGNNVTATIPRPSKESRELIIANASRIAEKVGIYCIPTSLIPP